MEDCEQQWTRELEEEDDYEEIMRGQEKRVRRQHAWIQKKHLSLRCLKQAGQSRQAINRRTTWWHDMIMSW